MTDDVDEAGMADALEELRKELRLLGFGDESTKDLERLIWTAADVAQRHRELRDQFENLPEKLDGLKTEVQRELQHSLDSLDALDEVGDQIQTLLDEN